MLSYVVMLCSMVLCYVMLSYVMLHYVTSQLPDRYYCTINLVTVAFVECSP
jgi:hypothetical protein